ncbi:uncharacterized protein LOC128988094 [Macrosteles quadrilineatus]|uniref:uncharacterized protein LOC128988094 n=1 Tax=Macrosteles quadrilineatus TaxID=74068 RepID=UPI0023E27421|nr:uncharacterized protein LOC128988094 [Macrosteles quadrilineatus]XP_054265271.1 uncharacterized protein LOC128988094 [Macrosteles quadrilineatus]
MSDDEEIIFKHNDLCNHLINQGYFDFETFSPTTGPTSKTLNLLNTEDSQTKIDSCFRNSLKKSITLSQFQLKQLEILRKSKLLFNEDADDIETAIENSYVNKSKSKWFWHLSTVAGFFCSITLRKKGTMFYLPFGITVFLTAYLLKHFFEDSKKTENCRKLEQHVHLLQSLCLDIQKLLRFVKETEILSKKIEYQSTLYKPILAIPIDEDNKQYLERTQSHLRKCLLDSLADVIAILTSSYDYLQKQLPDDMPTSGSDNIDCFIKNRILNPKHCTSLEELQILNKTYLSLQSDYLKLISFYVCPEMFGCFHYLRNKISEVLNFCHSLESKLRNISFRLKMQYAINNIYSVTHTSCKQRPLIVNNNQLGLSKIQVEVHNIFLLILSMLLRVRNVEEYLEMISGDDFDDQNGIAVSVQKQLDTLRHDLASTSKCFDLISRQLSNGDTNHSKSTPDEVDENIAAPTQTINATNIVVGASDFSVNSPDEVFIAISGLGNEEIELDSDDYFEKKPQLPVNLMLELSDRLKSRKQQFNAREKAALARDGLLDFPDNPIEGIAHVGETNFRAVKQLSESFGSSMKESESLINDVEFEICYDQIKQYKPRVEYSDSESDSQDSNGTERVRDTPPINQLSLANMAAMKSQFWRNTADEECFSDG